MKIVCIGGGPAGLYFATLMKKEDPQHQVVVLERNQPDDTFGFGVVFSDATMQNLADADLPSYQAVTSKFAHWDDIDIHYRGQVMRSSGHGFAGLSRHGLLAILQKRAQEVGVEITFGREVKDPDEFPDADLIIAADGVNSGVRTRLAEAFHPQVDFRPNRFVWLGTTFPFPAFTFYFRANEHGLFRVHAYRYEEGHSTFIIECTEDTFRRSGLTVEDEDATLAYCQTLFAKELAGHSLLKNRSVWRQFPNVRVGKWHHDNVVLMGDAVHTAHFSIGSGTKLALEDAISLRDALRGQGLAQATQARPTRAAIVAALEAYEAERRPPTESLQRAAQVSLEWFENTERYMDLPPEVFGMSLLTRSLRLTHDNLKTRDADFVANVDAWVAGEAARQAGVDAPASPAPPPMFTPFKLRGMLLSNRVVMSPMCQYAADDGTVGDWHLVHLGSRAVGGAGLIMTEMTDVSREGRISLGCAGMYKPEHVAAWRRVVDFVHDNSAAKIGMQLGHAGRKAATHLLWEGDNQPLDPAAAWPIMAASALPYLPTSQVPRAMDRADMERVRDEHVRSARMADEAGFDMLELHAAHGYLLASFISPLLNQRQDEYGGDLVNRLRYPLEVWNAIRAVWPSHKPMSVRISAVDWAPGGTTPADAVEIARAFKATGCDIVDVSSGQTLADVLPAYGRLYQTPFSDRIRLEAGIPTMTVGNVSSYADVNSIIAAGRADLCVLARAHLYDPYWTRHAASEQDTVVPWPPQYRSVTHPRYKPRL